MGTFDEAENLVRQFHREMELPVASFCTLLRCDGNAAAAWGDQILELAGQTAAVGATSGDLLLSRVALALEELGEWVLAHRQGDLAAAADAWADRAYVLLGDAVAAGLPTSALFDVVHRSNMSKQPTPGGGKPRKGAEFTPPDVRMVLRRARLKDSLP
jgi:predicted HAD superfamily Cof-like phosphohydrolase